MKEGIYAHHHTTKNIRGGGMNCEIATDLICTIDTTYK